MKELIRNKRGRLSGPGQTTLIKWGGVVVVLIVVLLFIAGMWEKFLENQTLAIILVIGILVLVFGGGFTAFGIKIFKK
ncbi:MAG: hypothetical protein KJ771_00160 [Nanoarchaeota archaeon]|nr:hypothetical protein [Nanoarchaeota archaeon]